MLAVLNHYFQFVLCAHPTRYHLPLQSPHLAYPSIDLRKIDLLGFMSQGVSKTYVRLAGRVPIGAASKILRDNQDRKNTDRLDISYDTHRALTPLKPFEGVD